MSDALSETENGCRPCDSSDDITDKFETFWYILADVFMHIVLDWRHFRSLHSALVLLRLQLFSTKELTLLFFLYFTRCSLCNLRGESLSVLKMIHDKVNYPSKPAVCF